MHLSPLSTTLQAAGQTHHNLRTFFNLNNEDGQENNDGEVVEGYGGEKTKAHLII